MIYTCPYKQELHKSVITFYLDLRGRKTLYVGLMKLKWLYMANGEIFSKNLKIKICKIIISSFVLYEG
jgi:hypothetical protein